MMATKTQPVKHQQSEEWALRDSDGMLHTGEREGLHWTRAQAAEHATDQSDRLLVRAVLASGSRGPWCVRN